ncbi:MAG: TolC family protein [Tannerellaceae bacterium]|nr:TolC family protein [Tannerellaceae bacterium]
MKRICIYMTGIFFSLLPGILPRAQAAEKEGYSHPELTLSEYLQRVGNGNLEYIAEKFNIKIAEAEIIAAKVLPDPEIAFEAGEDFYSVELSYDLELGGKRKARVRLARSEAELERLAVEFFFRELSAEAADAFLEALKEKEILQFRRSSYDYMLQLSQSDSIRHRLGEITENDARQSRLEAASLLNEVYEQEANFESALVTLNQYMGRNADTLYIPSGHFEVPYREFSLRELTMRALENRLDLMASLKNSEIAMNQLKLAKAERRIDLGLMVGFERDWNGWLPERDMVKAGISVPLPFSNTNKGALRSARLAVEKSKVEQQSVELQIEAEVAQAYLAFEAARKQVNQYNTVLLEDAQKLLDGVVYTYKRGETDILEVLIAQRTYNEIREQHIETVKDFRSALIELERACGTNL